jgi:hypothetical protein
MPRKNKKPRAWTIVIFRKFKEGDVIALFPDIPFDDQGNVASYSHIGQHGAADYETVLEETVPAREPEYRALLAEIKRVGYTDLEIKEVPPEIRQGNLFSDS